MLANPAIAPTLRMPEIDLSLFIYGLIVGLGAGAVAGILAGLAGVGGGLIYVPVFYACMPGDADGVAVQVFASLVAVIITAFFSARAHWRLKHIDYPAVNRLLPGLIIGAALGLWCTLRLPEAWVLLALAGLDAWIAFDFGRQPRRLSADKPAMLSLFSGPIGFISGALGIGGGTMLTPLLRRFVDLRFAVGTSALCGLIMAFGAVSMNVMVEAGWRDILAEAWPFLSGAWLGVMLVLPKSSGWAARLHTRLSESALQLLLKTTFTALSIGLFLAALLS